MSENVRGKLEKSTSRNVDIQLNGDPGHSTANRAVAAEVDAHCDHCGDRVPAGLIDDSSPLQFCCAGCRTVYDVIHSCGLERYYALKREFEQEAPPAKFSHRRFGEFDDPTFRKLYVRELGGSIASVELYLPAAHCAACVWLIEKLPRVARGVIEARLDLRRSLVRITWDERIISLSAIARALDSLGYSPAPARAASIREARRLADRKQIVSLGIAGACAGNVMLLALAMYAGMFDAIESPYLHLFRWVSMGISLVSLAWPGRVFFIGARNALRMRTLHLDVPIALGLGAGAIWGVISTIRGTGEIYFDSLSVLVFALLLGRYIQSRQQRWTSDAVELLFSLTPTSARVVADEWANGSADLPIEAVQRGMIVEVRAGESIPVDGVVLRGESKIDQSLLTGESRPVDVHEGMGVAAGASNITSTLRVRVDATGEDTRVGKLMKMVEECAQRRAPIVQLADRIAGWFLAAVLALTAITFAAWMFINAASALDRAVALLIVTCPCALGLATPMAMSAAIGRAAKNGMLVKGGDAIQRLASATRKPGIIFLDKTGTITQGKLSLVKWFGDETIKPIVAAIERHSSHPIAQALLRDLNHDEFDPALAIQVDDVRQTLGGGIEGQCEGQRFVIGSPRFVRAQCLRQSEIAYRAERECGVLSLTPVLIAVDGQIIAAAGLGDSIRIDSAEAINALQQEGWEIRILSGDHADLVKSVGRQLSISERDCIGGATPEQKLAIVQNAMNAARSKWNRGGAERVIMVGDGVNDAAALAAADVGIAVHGGAEASLAAADIYINQPGLVPIVSLVAGANRTMKVIRRSLGVSLAYNLIAAALAATGLINPLIAAILMPASSLTVVTMSFRSRTFAAESRGNDAEGGR